MSEQFEYLLTLRRPVATTMDLTYVLCLILLTFIFIKKSKRDDIKVFGITTLFIFINFILAQAIFEIWWSHLYSSASSPEDHTWIANHDGGGPIIVFIINCFKCSVCFIIAMIISKLIMRKQKKISTNEV